MDATIASGEDRRRVFRFLPPRVVQPLWRRILLGAGCGLAAVLVRLPLEPLLVGSAPFIVFMPGVTVAAVRGGAPAAAAAVAVTVLYLVLSAAFVARFRVMGPLPLALYVMASALVTLVAVELRSALTQLREREAVLKAASDQQQLLMGELSHRMKNTLSMVQAIVSQTLRASTSLDAARAEIMARLAVLSRAQDVLTRTSWTSALLGDIVEAALAPLSLAPERLAVSGPDVPIGSRAALSFTLALHELGTNSLKYGALSAAAGRIEIRWSLEGGAAFPLLRFRWSEMDGPPVSPPARKGFGSRLIESVSRTFAGESTLHYAPTGVSWEVTADAKTLMAF